MNKTEVCVVSLLFSVPAVFLGFFLGCYCMVNNLHRDAIEHGAARYNERTAAFEWVESEKGGTEQ